MAARPLPLARKDHAVAFEGLAAWLQQDPTLKRVVKNWSAWEGDDDDDSPWAPDGEVGVRLTPELGPADVEAILGGGARLWSRPLDITVEVYLPSSRAADTLNVPDALDARVTPADDTVRAALELKLAEWGVLEILTLQAPTPVETSERSVRSVGRYRLEMLIPG